MSRRLTEEAPGPMTGFAAVARELRARDRLVGGPHDAPGRKWSRRAGESDAMLLAESPPQALTGGTLQ
ncbi:hypothetical protein [Streptomyces sp. NPDC056672]|uniref:hypothetical protein n=1 Tax=Streptomyces sp. NPDC056672 TaxID=3345906 RepID=UPI0036A00B60